MLEAEDRILPELLDAEMAELLNEHLQQQGIDAGINTDIPDFAASFFEKAIEAGHGQKNVMALVKVLQGDSGVNLP